MNEKRRQAVVVPHFFVSIRWIDTDGNRRPKMTFDPDLNPYIAQLESHRDLIISTSQAPEEDQLKIGRGEEPIVVDLGCGAGNFLRDFARLRPHWFFFGFELRYKRLVKAAVKFKKHNLTNVRLLQARSEDVAHWFFPDSIREIHINFPDPWPKKRHRKHRLINSRFLEIIHRLLEKDGIWVLKTDHAEYFTEAVALINQSPLFDVIAYSEDLHRSDFMEHNILTEFEQLFRNKGCPVHYVKSQIR